MLGVMLVSMFLSMWVDNTGATAMILPVVDALVQELFRVRDFQFTLEHLELKKKVHHSAIRTTRRSPPNKIMRGPLI